MTTTIFIPVAQDRIALAAPGPGPEGLKVPGLMTHVIVWTDPAGRRYEWRGVGASCARFLPASGAFGSVPELLPADWLAAINTSIPMNPLYDIGGTVRDVFEIHYIYPHVVCPHCQTMHLASSWGRDDSDDAEPAYLCPDCRNWRDVELVYEKLPYDVLWECCRRNMAQKQEEDRAKWDREFARLYSRKGG